MQIVLKIITGLALGSVGCLAWFLGVIGAVTSFNGFMNVVHGMHAFNRSQCSLFDAMALHASTRDPGHNAEIDFDTAMIILLVITVLTLITLLQAGITSTLCGMLGRGFMLLAGGVMLSALSCAAIKWLSNQPWAAPLFVGVALGYTLNFLARWLLNSSAQPIAIPVDTD